MNKDIALYLDGNKVEWPKVPDILLTYQRTDYTNPTVTKNMFSKTVTIEGTPNNNDIFNHIWNLERVMDDGFTLFNPSQKVPFELYNDCEIVETGYAKLDSINKEGYKIAYNITLYGGLGSFFYSLAYDINTDKEKTLADLNFMGGPNPDDEFDFEISKDTVNEAWDALNKYGYNTGSTKKYDYFNFMPAYNGLPDSFDSDKVLINTNEATGMAVRWTNNNGVQYGTFPTSVGNDGVTYTPYNGYVYGEMQRDCTEWEMRDLRSYLQRPVLSVKGLFNAIKNPLNNGGYNVRLDPEFFSSGNPYYYKAWMTLPMLDSSMVTDDSIEPFDWFKTDRVVDNRPRFMFLKLKPVTPFGDTPDSLKFNFEIHTKFTGATANTLYMSAMYHSSGIQQDGAPVGDWMAANIVAFQFYINKNENLGTDNVDDIASSNRIILASRLPNGSYWISNSPDLGSMPTNNTQKQWAIGVWKKVSGDDYVWEMEDGTREFNIELETNHINTIPLIGFMTKTIYNLDNTGFDYSDIKDGYSYDAQYYGSKAELNAHSFKHLFQDYPLDLGGSEVVYKGGYTVRSYQQMKKKNLLEGVEGTPCDWLLSYCKLFGLFISKDKVENTIRIQMRKNWYKNEQLDLEELIDRSKSINVTPLTFESKWYNFKYEESEGKFLDKYKDAYSQDFGKQLIDTKYNFDADEIDLLEDNNFKNGLTCLEKSNYYNVKKDMKDFVIFPCLYNWCTVRYFYNDENYDIYMALPAGTNTTFMNPNTPKEYYDFLPKLQFHDKDNNGTDGDGVLVFFNGIKGSGDVDYWLTDDVEEMFDNSDNACWLQTHSEWNASWTEHIAIQRHSLPSFNRYVEKRNIITAAWDFGYTKELYVPYYQYDVNRTPTMYENFWKAYIQDLYSVDTRKVDCYVNLNSNDVYDFMKKFYWWDNSLWVCTKVSDFDIALDKSTLCSFTKVNDITAYFDTPTFNDDFFNFYRNDGGHNIPAQGTAEDLTFSFGLDSSTNWVVTNDGAGFASFDPNTPLSGSYGVGHVIRASYLPNYSPSPRYSTFIADNLEGEQRMIRVWQDGYVKEKYLKLDPTTVWLPKVVETPVDVVIDSSGDWAAGTIATWASINPANGLSGQSIISVSATTNDTGDERQTQTTITNNDGLSQVLVIKQKGNAKVTLEQNEIFSAVYTVPASGGNVHYRLTADIETEVRPMGNTANYAVASGLITYNTTIQPTSGTNFWIHFDQNNSTVSRNAAFYAYYEEDQGRYSVFPTIVPLPLQQLAAGNKIVELDEYSHNETTQLGASMRWTATTNTSWITLTTTTGSSSDNYIQYSVLGNMSNYRVGYIYVTYIDEMGYYCNEVIEVRQDSGVQTLVVNPTEVDFKYTGGSCIIEVTSSTVFNVSVSASWITHTITRDGAFLIDVAPNDGYERSSVITVSSNGQTATVTVNQASKYPSTYTLDYVPQDLVFDASGGSITVTIRSDSNWTITSGSNIG